MILSSLPAALFVALAFSTLYFSAALFTGVWKWRAMLSADDGQAHSYVNIAHHAALHYGPFIVLAGLLASAWPWNAVFPAWILVVIMGITMVASLARYISLGVRGTIINQLHHPTSSARSGLLFFFFGSVLPGQAIVIGALGGLWSHFPAGIF